MPDQGVNPDDNPDHEPKLDDDDPGEVPTAFPTKGVGWSGRDKQEEEDAPPRSDRKKMPR